MTREPMKARHHGHAPMPAARYHGPMPPPFDSGGPALRQGRRGRRLAAVQRRRLDLALGLAVTWLAAIAAGTAQAQSEHETRLANAAAVLAAFTAEEQTGIPAELLARAYGIAVIPNVIRGGFLLGARRGRGVLTVRLQEGRWSNPAMITLTGGSIGWQFGAESAEVVLVFANERSVRNIEDGKFTLGGNVTAIAGPLGRHTAAALTGRAEVYAYIRSRGLFAGAAFEGARLDVDEQGSERFYRRDPRAQPLAEPNDATPEAARRFLRALEVAAQPATAPAPKTAPTTDEEAQTFPFPGA